MAVKRNVFLGLTPASGLIPAWSSFLAEKKPKELKFSPWYKMHLTLFFWPGLTREETVSLYNELNELEIVRESGHASDIRGFSFFKRPQVLYLKEMSDEIIDLHRRLYPHTRNLKTGPEPRDPERFVPHWTIARKFTPPLLKRENSFFNRLDSFTNRGSVPAIELFFSFNGRYEPLPFQR